MAAQMACAPERPPPRATERPRRSLAMRSWYTPLVMVVLALLELAPALLSSRSPAVGARTDGSVGARGAEDMGALEAASAACGEMGGTMGAAIGDGLGAPQLVCCPAICGGCGGGSSRCCADAIAAAGAPCGGGGQPPCVLGSASALRPAGNGSEEAGVPASHRRRLGAPSPLDFILTGPGLSNVVAGSPNWFTIEIVDVNRARIGDEAGLSAADFTTRSSLPSCRAFGGDLYDQLERLGLTPPCPASVISFTQTSVSSPWLWNVTFTETSAGSFYMEIFFRDDPNDSTFDLAVRVGGSPVAVSVAAGRAHPEQSWLQVPDMYVTNPAVAESSIFITAFVHDEFGNPTDVGADAMTTSVMHSVGGASSPLTGGNLTHSPSLFPGLESSPRRAGFAATATLIPWGYDWTLPQFSIFPIITPSLVTHGGNPNMWLFEDS